MHVCAPTVLPLVLHCVWCVLHDVCMWCGSSPHCPVLCCAVVAGTLFVGTCYFDVDEEVLREFVTSQGHTPSALRIITSNDGRSKG